MRIVWLFLLGEGDWVKLLPLHLCGLQVLFIPLAVFTRSEALRSYVWATSILGGITAIVYPAGIVGTYPFFLFQTFQSFALHLLLILVPILMRTAPLAWLLIIGLRRFTIITPDNNITEKTARKLQLL